jgi:transposase
MFSFDGYRIDKVTFSPEIVQVQLRLDRRKRLCCPGCGGKVRSEISEPRTARDMPFGPAVYALIMYPAIRIRCSHCRQQAWLSPPEIDSRRRVTLRLLRYAALLARDLPNTKAAALLGVGDTRLRNWDKAVLAEHLPKPDLDNIQFLMIDEKAIGKGHDYVTVVLNGESGELLHCHEGKKKESLKTFFDKLTDEQKACIKAVCVDRAGAYVSCVEEELPGARIAFDKFHLVKNFNAVVDKIRREEWNKARADKDDKNAKVIKGQRYNLLRRPENNTDKQQARLDELLAMNEPLNKVYVLVEDFRDVLSQNYVGHAKNCLKLWIETAISSGIKAVVKFAKSLEKVSDKIINAVRFDLSNGRMEGFNNLFARLIHRGCGYSDNAYLYLKLRQASLPDELKVPALQK